MTDAGAVTGGDAVGSGGTPAGAGGGTGAGQEVGRMAATGGTTGATPESGPGRGAAGALERRYRRLLVLLPRAYRAARGEEMLTVLMDAAPESRRWPKPGEALSLAALGIRTRSGLNAGFVPPEAASPLVRAVAIVGSLYFSFLGANAAFRGFSWHWSYYAADTNLSDLDGHHHAFGQIVLMQTSGLVWLAAFAALLAGRAKVVRAAGLVLAVYSVTQITGFYTLLAALAPLLVAAALIQTGRRPVARVPRLWWWSTAVVPLVAVAWYLSLNLVPRTQSGVVVQTSPLIAIAVAALVVGVLKARRTASWALAFAIVGALSCGQRALEVNHDPLAWDLPFDPFLRILLIGEAALVLAAAYAVLRPRRTLPLEPESGGSP